jgi:hypothetical protein
LPVFVACKVEGVSQPNGGDGANWYSDLMLQMKVVDVRQYVPKDIAPKIGTDTLKPDLPNWA